MKVYHEFQAQDGRRLRIVKKHGYPVLQVSWGVHNGKTAHWKDAYNGEFKGSVWDELCRNVGAIK